MKFRAEELHSLRAGECVGESEETDAGEPVGNPAVCVSFAPWEKTWQSESKMLLSCLSVDEGAGSSAPSALDDAGSNFAVRGH